MIVPKSLAPYISRIEAVDRDSDGSWFIALRRGWKNSDDPMGVAESALAEAVKKVRYAVACDCVECVTPKVLS
jgi:hypothetical protein